MTSESSNQWGDIGRRLDLHRYHRQDDFSRSKPRPGNLLHVRATLDIHCHVPFAGVTEKGNHRQDVKPRPGNLLHVRVTLDIHCHVPFAGVTEKGYQQSNYEFKVYYK